ncbi:MAG: hypothetical protein QXP91_12080 [Candidatus Methanomethylicia archaeon]
MLWPILSSCRKLLGFLSFGRSLPVNLNEWCLKFRAILEAKEWGKSKKHLTIAIDENCLKLKEVWVYAVIDVDTRSL